jgi:hypothetical protein
MTFARLTAGLFALSVLTACVSSTEIAVEPSETLGNFRLGHNIVVADNPQKVPISREAKPEDWDRSLTDALEKRLRRYDGDKFFNLGVSVDAYALAPPGIPLIVSPKSVLVITATLWDDSAGQKINEKASNVPCLRGLMALRLSDLA